MLTKKLAIFLLAGFAVALTAGILAVALQPRSNSDGELRHTEGGVTLIADPADVRLESENLIHLRLDIVNSGIEPVAAWALDLGKGLYLVKAEPKELLYHRGHSKAAHGNVLVYGIPIGSGEILSVELALRVLFDTEGNLDSNPEFRLSYARSAWEVETLDIKDVQTFRDTFVTFPFVTTSIHIER